MRYIIQLVNQEEVDKMEIIKKTLNFPKPLAQAITAYQKTNMLPTFTAAMQELIRKGLELSRKEG